MAANRYANMLDDEISGTTARTQVTPYLQEVRIQCIDVTNKCKIRVADANACQTSIPVKQNGNSNRSTELLFHIVDRFIGME